METDNELEQIRQELDESYVKQKHNLEHLLVLTRERITDLDEKLQHIRTEELRKKMIEHKLMLDHHMQELQHAIHHAIQHKNFAHAAVHSLIYELEAKPTEDELREQNELEEEMTLAIKEAEEKHLENRFSLYEQARKLRLTPYR
jgi:hypothetical protein